MWYRVKCFREVSKDDMCAGGSIQILRPLMDCLEQEGLAGVALLETMLMVTQLVSQRVSEMVVQ